MSTPSRARRRMGGFALIEVMISMAMLSIGALSIYQSVISYQDLSRLAHDRNIAYFDLETALEDLQSTPFANIVTKFPNNQRINKFEGLHLQRERITVHYTNPASDPLYVTLTVTWRDAKARNVSESLMTARTR
ncbi:MAG: prepilin-type N-terminal cleavage/methylation domain-containing protein [Planctomycetes bacterium]|nr:prepilin-type N-terminal cleavage/methylation domain-containing protein [Planctomycetota bacterium]MBI3846461.1 prepilin-type N-terminal cleavage/methylation domain-containing protein [Planctomycetota bacterium]